VENQGEEGNIILKFIFKKWDGEVDWIYLALVRASGCCECGNELSGSIKCGEFLD
jgi:hypothetical protein